MNQPLTLPTESPDEPSMDYAKLQQEGIRQLERLAGGSWTDYNIHDPGITILEQLCYAITDLGYRIGYDIKDLLASNDDGNPYRAIFSPAEVLTTEPVTLTDFRKVVIDVPGVKNAWVEPVENPEPAVFYDPADHTLYLEKAPHRKPVPLRGVCRVLIESDGSVADPVLSAAVSRRLHACRPLCQDFESPTVLKLQEIIINADVEIAEVANPEVLLAKIYHALDGFISPRLRFFTLAEMLARGKRIDEIMDGPVLQHGFIDSEELQHYTRKTGLRTSDLIQVIMDVPGVRAVRSITLTSGDRTDPWYLELDWDKDYAPSLNGKGSRIRLLRGQVAATTNPADIERAFEDLRRADAPQPLLPSQRDIPPPAGRDRRVANYYSLQHQFPAAYGVGQFGLPDSAPAARKAQAKQLKAYLMLFDQLLANYFAQLASARKLFSFDPTPQSYFSQTIDDASLGLDEIHVPADNDGANPQTETGVAPAAEYERKNRFLDHLLARHGEEFTDYSLLTHAHIAPQQLVDAKAAFLRDYRDIGGGRGRAFDYTRPAWDNDNVSGLEKSISRKLGLSTHHRRSLAEMAAGDEGGFHMLEHILLRPGTADKDQWPPNARALGSPFAFVAKPFCTDPYSARLSFVFPAWIERFKPEDFRSFIRKTLHEETPAHLSLQLHWLSIDQMRDFESAYQDWLAARSAS